MRYILPSASFCLAPGVVVDDGELRDSDGHTYPLNAAGAATCAIASRAPVELSMVVAQLTLLYDDDADSLEEAVTEFVSDLSRRGLISVHQSFAREWLDSMAVLPLHLLVNRRINWSLLMSEWYIYRRYRPTVVNVVRACFEGHQVSMWALTAVVAGAGAATAVIGTPTGAELFVTLPAILSVLSFFALTHFTSLLIHELMHIVAARATGSSVSSVYLRPGAVGIAFRAPTLGARITVLVAGAACAIVYLLVTLALILFVPGHFWSGAGIDQLRLSGVVAVVALIAGQLLCFTPLTRDGTELIASVIGFFRQRQTA